MPGYPVALFTDQQVEAGVFDVVHRISAPTRSFRDKIGPLSESPFERTVFLDTDTWLCSPVPELFTLLDKFDLALAHAPMRATAASRAPDAFPEFNSGVIAFRNCPEVLAVFAAWAGLYAERLAATGVPDDQPSLRDALWRGSARVAALPPEYNLRTVLPMFAGRGPVRIIHGRHRNVAAIERRINRHAGCRVFLPGDREFVPARFGILSGISGLLVAPMCAVFAGAVRLQDALTRWKRRFAGGQKETSGN